MSGRQSIKEKDLYYGLRNDDNRIEEGREKERVRVASRIYVSVGGYLR